MWPFSCSAVQIVHPHLEIAQGLKTVGLAQASLYLPIDHQGLIILLTGFFIIG